MMAVVASAAAASAERRVTSNPHPLAGHLDGERVAKLVRARSVAARRPRAPRGAALPGRRSPPRATRASGP
jgi:hypothetical protein